MAVTYTGDPSATDEAAVRFEIGDTNVNAPIFQDAEIAWAILNETGTAAGSPATITNGPLYSAAARCFEVLARQLSTQADNQVGSLRTQYAKASENAAKRAAELRMKASSFYAPYVGGQSYQEKESFAQDTDKIAPLFRIRQYNNPWSGPQDALAPEDFGPPLTS